jgi:hypothetical protein
MKLTRRVTFSSKALAQKRKLPINWDAMTAVATAGSALISLLVLYIAVRALRYTESQIEDYRKESQAQNLIQKVQEFDGSRYKAVRKGLAEKRINRSLGVLKKLDLDDTPVEMSDELSFCNDLGILTRHEALSAYDVWGEFSYWLLPLYADAQPLIKADQKDAPASWSNCIYLVEQVRKVDEHEDAGRQLNQKDEDIGVLLFRVGGEPI